MKIRIRTQLLTHLHHSFQVCKRGVKFAAKPIQDKHLMRYNRTEIMRIGLLRCRFAVSVAALQRCGARHAAGRRRHGAQTREAVRSLLKQKVDVNAPQPDGTTALHWAVRQDDLETADLLIRAGANVKAANRFGATPLSLAATNGNAAMIEKLLKAGEDANAVVSEAGDTALMLAARTGKPDAVAMLLNHGADVNKTNANGQTALMWAAAEKNAAAVQVLIEHKADLNAQDACRASAEADGHDLLRAFSGRRNDRAAVCRAAERSEVRRRF